MRNVSVRDLRKHITFYLHHLLFVGVMCVSSLAVAKDAPPARPAGGRESPAAAWERLGLPNYEQPSAYSEDLVVTYEGQTYIMKRAVTDTKMRTEMTVDGQEMIIIEMGDKRGTMYLVMPDRKEAIKQSLAATDEMTPEKMREGENISALSDSSAEVTDMEVEDLGDDVVNGVAARKTRLMTSDGEVLAWFDKATGGPLRMEGMNDGKTAAIEWRNHKAERPDPKVFEVPKGYEIVDMDAMAEQMKNMGGMEGMAGGMMSGMAQGMGQGMGAQLGSAFGGALGGPLGSVAGQYIGGRVGGAIGKKAGDTLFR